MPREPKPSWLRILCPPGNLAKLEAQRCEGCSRWVVSCRQGVWESWDPGIITGQNLTIAIILQRPLTRIQWIPGLRQAQLEDVSGRYGITPDGQYLSLHDCQLAPISHTPYKPLRQQRKPGKPFPTNIKLTKQEIKTFERIWNTPTSELKQAIKQ
ncbi:hypothetical protein PT279_09100 [Bifidobacterium sp. ESL0784]|uniref:hypothetical protein n=1 Tax=Bifidobacterium sp. ESL0784 TaxID=2983231 RepID=UPI0023F8D5BB|nr:hypothetical protein [Bifidobacterium sp. ESL0784]